MTGPDRPTPPSPVPPVRLETLLEDFVWLRLIRAPMLALAPSRWIIALLAVLAISILREAFGEHLLSILGERIGAPAWRAAAAILTLNFSAAAEPIQRAIAGALFLLLDPPSLASILLALPELIIWVVTGCAISRMVALDFARGEPCGPRAGLGFGLARTPAALGAIAAPLLVVAGLGAIVAVMWVLAAIPVLDIIIAALSLIALLMSLLAVLLIVFTLLGAPLMIPATTCDGADAADAVQRAWAYLVSRPIQIFIAALAAAALGFILLGIVGWIIEASINAMQAWASAWSDRAGDIATGRQVVAPPPPDVPDATTPAGPSGTAAPASWLAGMWIQTARAAVTALAVSYFFTAATLIYLFVRQSCDGQDYTDLWSPGATEALIAEALKARQGAADLPAPRDGAERLGARGGMTNDEG